MHSTDQPNAIPHSKPCLNQAEVDAATEVIRSGIIAQGPKVRELGVRWSQLVQMPYAVPVASGTSALCSALKVLDIGAGDEVIVPAYSCVALMNAVLSVGATPVLSDVLPSTWTISAEQVRSRVNARTRAVIAVHLFGAASEMTRLADLGVPIVEDCAHGIGGYCGSSLPFGGAGAISISSFYATKMLAAGEGGIVATRDPDKAGKIMQWRDYADQSPDGNALNNKMTDIQAAIALTQIEKLPSMLEARATLAVRYHEWLEAAENAGLLRRPPRIEGRVWYRYVVELTRNKASQIARAMHARGIRAEQPVWDYRDADRFDFSSLPQAEKAFDRLLSLPLFPDLSEQDQNRVCSALETCLWDSVRV